MAIGGAEVAQHGENGEVHVELPLAVRDVGGVEGSVAVEAVEEEEEEVERLLHAAWVEQRVVAEEEEQLAPGGGDGIACASRNGEDGRSLLGEEQEEELFEQGVQVDLFCVRIAHAFYDSVVDALDKDIAEFVPPYVTEIPFQYHASRGQHPSGAHSSDRALLNSYE